MKTASPSKNLVGEPATELKSKDESGLTNHLKIRDMRDAITFKVENNDGVITLVPSTRAYGFDKELYKPHDLRKEVEPWLTALLQSDHLSLLVGAGLTTAVYRHATGKIPKGFGLRSFRVFDKEIQREAERVAKLTDRGDPNFEDQLRVAFRLIEGLRIVAGANGESDHSGRAELQELELDVKNSLEELICGVLATEREIVSALGEHPSDNGAHTRAEALAMLVSFLMSFGSRTGTRDRLGIFTTNYDRLIEFGAELAGVRLIDRFIGSLSPLFRSSRLDVDLHYNPPGIRGEPRYLEGVVRFSKLHGSLDWIDDDRNIRRINVPFGVGEIEKFTPNGTQGVLIYPRDGKDRETAEYPYVEIFRDFAAALCRPNSTLVTYGYSFGDEHINRVLRDMLTIPSTHIVIISYSDIGSRVMKFYSESKRTSQISLLIGDHFGDLRNLVDYYLPKPAIDRASIRMAELLRTRGYTEWREEKREDGDQAPAAKLHATEERS